MEMGELEFNKALFKSQIVSIIFLLFCFAFYGIYEQFNPEFFNFTELWNKTGNIWDSVFNYWYVFAWGLFLSIATCFQIRFIRESEKVLAMGTLTSILAGLWEEIGYRGVLIFTAMIGVWISNYFCFWLVVIGVIILAGMFCSAVGNWIVSVIVFSLTALFIWWFWGLEISNPIFWFYEHIIFPVLSFVSFGLLDPILYNENFSFLFIAGAVSANASFRDGHKYQGCFGFLNSWMLGFIFLHAMMHYGLVVAIICHMGYDLEISVVRYFARRIKGLAREGVYEQEE